MIDILENLAANPSRNYKIGLLQEHAGNTLLRELVRLALDPFTQFYIRKIPKYEATGDNTLAHAMDQLFELSSRLKTGNAGIEHLTQILTSLSPKNAMIIERIIAKDLKCGVSIATANDVWPGLIMEYPVMLCSGFEQKLIDKIQWPAMVQLKMDGMRFNAVVRDGQVEFKTRNGKTIDLLGNLEQEFIQLSNGIDCIFDGELLVSNDDGVMDRQTGNGILNKALKGTITQNDASLVRATVWDYIPYAYFTSGHCPIAYKDRFAKLVNLPEKIRLVESTIVENIDQANELFKSYYDKGEEGIILKDMNEDWQDKRVKHQIKFKGELECDLKVVGFEPGTGKYVGKLGALICESDDGIIKVKVGSGFNDEDRESIKEQDVIGKVVAVKYNARIRSKSEDESLFLPIFLEIREDKDKADSSGSIK